MSDSEHARDLLAKAAEEARALRCMLDQEAFPDWLFGFHAQQAVEKALKAWIAACGLEYPRTHDLGELIEVLREHGRPVAGVPDPTELNPFAVRLRYMSIGPADAPLDRQAVIGIVDEVVALASSGVLGCAGRE